MICVHTERNSKPANGVLKFINVSKHEKEKGPPHCGSKELKQKKPTAFGFCIPSI